MTWQVLEADCIQAMQEMDAASVDAIVCDPPYGLGFMGKAWDGLPPGLPWAQECLRVLKPGGHLLAFGGTRTYHRLACAIEDAGFEVRDCLAWLYGSGFPKSHNIGDGRGTALKPAHEPIVMARKPLTGTVAANVLEHGTGALNVDGCRIGPSPGYSYPNGAGGNSFTVAGEPDGTRTKPVESPSGRWPANVLLDTQAAELLDAQTGEQKSGTAHEPNGKPMERSIYGATGTLGRTLGYGDTGGSSRFFYVAKASRAERNAGLDGFEERELPHSAAMKCGACGLPILHGERKTCECQTKQEIRQSARNVHPTVKPIALMRWLVRLVTPPGGTVLDPFTGSGTTGIAAVLEGFDFIGIEREAEYVEIAKARIAHHAGQPVQMTMRAA